MSYFAEANTPNYERDKLENETQKGFWQRVRLEQNAANDKAQAEHGAPKIVYVEVPVETEKEITQEEKDFIIAEYLAAEKERKAAERKAKAAAKAAAE